MLIPSIDLMNGKAVQLQQGDKKIIERDDVFELLEEFSLYGEVAIIDLDAAMGKGSNRDLIEQLLRQRPCRVGGGIRDEETARGYLAAGATKIILGTSASQDWVKKLPRQALIFAIDAKDDYLTTHGWKKTQDVKVLDIIADWAQHCGEFLYTQVKKEGMMQGIDQARIQGVIEASPIPVTVAGGITSYEDLQWINQHGANSQIGMAIYSGKMSLNEAFECLVDFDKLPLMPTVVQDVDSGKVLMMAYSSKASLRHALTTRTGTYFSRSRNEIWTKGLTSGNTQKLIQVDVDCDGDTLLFLVKQTNNACHFDRYSCFASQRQEYSLSYLDEVLTERQAAAQNSSQKSFSQQLFTDKNLQIEKLNEECAELIEASEHNHVRWEAADLLFFALVMAKAKGVSIQEIINDLRSRNHER
jgi:phosphoribosyl-ATP pyrophosphohydrolase/phosphoribosyl-AMP cyclohydrolase